MDDDLTDVSTRSSLNDSSYSYVASILLIISHIMVPIRPERLYAFCSQAGEVKNIYYIPSKNAECLEFIVEYENSPSVYCIPEELDSQCMFDIYNRTHAQLITPYAKRCKMKNAVLFKNEKNKKIGLLLPSSPMSKDEASPLESKFFWHMVEHFGEELVANHLNLEEKDGIICFNFPQAHMTCDRLFNLFSSFGPVKEIKIFEMDSKDGFCVRYHHHLFTKIAMICLKNFNFMGNKLALSYSLRSEKEPTCMERKMKRKYKETSWVHRFEPEDWIKYIEYAYFPTNTLCIFEIVREIRDIDLISLIFKKYGVRRVNIASFYEQSDVHNAVLTFSSINQAILALIEMNNKFVYLNACIQLKISFCSY